MERVPDCDSGSAEVSSLSQFSIGANSRSQDAWGSRLVDANARPQRTSAELGFNPQAVQTKNATAQKALIVDLDYEHLLSITLEAKRLGKSSWRDLSRREIAFAALALNRADWLQSDNLTIGQALELVGELASLVGAVEWAVTQ